MLCSTGRLRRSWTPLAEGYQASLPAGIGAWRHNYTTQPFFRKPPSRKRHLGRVAENYTSCVILSDRRRFPQTYHGARLRTMPFLCPYIARLCAIAARYPSIRRVEEERRESIAPQQYCHRAECRLDYYLRQFQKESDAPIEPRGLPAFCAYSCSSPKHPRRLDQQGLSMRLRQPQGQEREDQGKIFLPDNARRVRAVIVLANFSGPKTDASRLPDEASARGWSNVFRRTAPGAKK